jgi:hypothetical protein
MQGTASHSGYPCTLAAGCSGGSGNPNVRGGPKLSLPGPF